MLLTILQMRDMTCHEGPQEKYQVMLREQKQSERRVYLAFTWISVGKGRQGRLNNLELASLNNFGRLWAIVGQGKYLFVA